MNKRILIVSIIILLISILSIMLFNNEENVLENNKIERDKTYAIMVQNEDKTGYIESTSNTFPSDMTLNEELTNCVDEDGTKVTNPFTYENGIITVRTNKKIYCYLYFDIGSSSGGLEILNNPTTGLNTTLEGGLYRYQGASGTVDNYICFGTSDKDTCLNNTDAHMYRIIGITEDGKLKLMKNEALNSTMLWYGSSSSDIAWSDSLIFSSINGISYLTNITYMPSGWSDKIENITWIHGKNTEVKVTAEELYNAENAWTDTVNAKIGLIYAHDYAYAYQSGGLNCSNSGVYSLCVTSWMHITNCDFEAPANLEWTMSRCGLYGSNYGAWRIYLGGYFGGGNMNSGNSVRPVFFLKSDIQFIGGTGKSDDPFIIS